MSPSTIIKNENGNKCVICSYNKNTRALDFHHINPGEKDFPLSRYTRIEEARNEAAKYILVCSNCHREIHANIVEQSFLDTLPRASLPYFGPLNKTKQNSLKSIPIPEIETFVHERSSRRKKEESDNQYETDKMPTNDFYRLCGALSKNNSVIDMRIFDKGKSCEYIFSMDMDNEQLLKGLYVFRDKVEGIF